MQEQTITLPSNKQIEDAIVRAYDAIRNASNKAASSDITQTAANTLITHKYTMLYIISALVTLAQIQAQYAAYKTRFGY
jgi:hypothetical protein